jgi:nicotinamidase-related amidase
MKALILVGLQSDFLAGGALPVPDADAVVAMANQLQLVSAFRFVVATQDWHPPIIEALPAIIRVARRASWLKWENPADPETGSLRPANARRGTRSCLADDPD